MVKLAKIKRKQVKHTGLRELDSELVLNCIDIISEG
jgi:hypothetical protein